MTSVHLPRLLTLEDWDALPEDNSAHFELQEGVLIVTPRPLRPPTPGQCSAASGPRRRR